MDTLTNAIVVKVQKTVNAEVNADDAELIRKITRKLVTMAQGEKKLILMTYSIDQIKQIAA